MITIINALSDHSLDTPKIQTLLSDLKRVSEGAHSMTVVESYIKAVPPSLTAAFLPVAAPDKKNIVVPRFPDTLFWCFFIISQGLAKYDAIIGPGFKEGQAYRIECVERARASPTILKKHRCPRRAFEALLMGKEKMTMKTFLCLCAIFVHNVAIVKGNLFLEQCLDPTTEQVTTIHYVGLAYGIESSCDTQTKLINYRKNYWTVLDITKPIRAISKYKVKELRSICEHLRLPIVDGGGKKLTRKIMYENISHYLLKLNKGIK